MLEPELVSVVNECQEPLIPRTYALRAGPEIVVERGTETFQARATELGREERDKVWERHKVDAPGFADYEAKTSRVIPVIALDRTG